MMKLGFACALALACSPSFAADKSLPPGFVYQLAKQPLALVEDNTCQIRGAVWAGGPRVGVNIELTSATGQIFKTKTNAAGVYAASLPYAGTTTTFQERIADPVYARSELASKVRVLSPPPIVCSQERTAAFLKATQGSAK